MREYRERYWYDINHKEHKISEMETKYIKSCILFLKERPYFYDQCGGMDYEEYYYDDNSHLVDKKIKEFENELQKRN